MFAYALSLVAGPSRPTTAARIAGIPIIPEPSIFDGWTLVPKDEDLGYVLAAPAAVSAADSTPDHVREMPLPIGRVLTEADVKNVVRGHRNTGYDPTISGWEAGLPSNWRVNVVTGGADHIKDASLRVVRLGEWYYVVRHEHAVPNKEVFTHLTVLVWRILDWNTELHNACLAGDKL